ncbi:hypothetical protein RRG08_002439 [Elysia crispata]|uniref:Uncharacterized protein n=1 Tax=Elysia crispata TaxID=231223 RepID=A0AAE1DV90_9GAST|nr:hypothetical protein RRG08_002439 [Elysia crispata]
MRREIFQRRQRAPGSDDGDRIYTISSSKYSPFVENIVAVRICPWAPPTFRHHQFVVAVVAVVVVVFSSRIPKLEALDLAHDRYLAVLSCDKTRNGFTASHSADRQGMLGYTAALFYRCT